MNFQGDIPAFIERPDQASIQYFLFGKALGQPGHTFAFQGHGHEYRCKVAAEQGFEVKVILFATQSVSDDSPQSGLMGVSQVGQRRRRGAEVSGSTRKRYENVLPHLLADELIWSQ